MAHNDRHEASAPQWQSKDCTMTTVQGMDTCAFVLEKWGVQTGKNEWIASWVWANMCTSQMLTIDTIYYPNVCTVTKGMISMVLNKCETTVSAQAQFQQFSAVVTALIAVSVQDLQPNSQDTSAFYLEKMYQLQVNPNVSCSSTVAQPPEQLARRLHLTAGSGRSCKTKR